MSSKNDFFQGLYLNPRPSDVQYNVINRLRISSSNSLLARPNVSQLNSTDNYSGSLNENQSAFGNVFHKVNSSFSTSVNSNGLINNSGSNHHCSPFRAPYVLPPRPAGLVINLTPKLQQLRNIRHKITSRQLHNIVQMKRILSANHQKAINNSDQNQKEISSELTNRFGNTNQHQHYNNCAVNEATRLASLTVQNSKNEAKLRERRAKFLKHLCKLEFSSLLYRKVYFRVSSLVNKIKYEQILEYDQYCGTSNKAVIKQNLLKTHLLKCKTSRSRTRILRSSEFINGKLTESWQRSDYTHVYTFNRRQRLRRYHEIQLSLGFQRRILRLVYQRMEITLPKLVECPSCKEKLDADRGHCCARRRLRRVKGVSLLCKQPKQNVGSMSNDISNLTGNSKNNSNGTNSIATEDDCKSCREDTSSFCSAALSMSSNNRNLLGNTLTTKHCSRDTSTSIYPIASGSGFSSNNGITESTTLMSIKQDKTEYYDYRPEQLGLPDLNESIGNESIGSDMDGDDISIIKITGPIGTMSNQNEQDNSSEPVLPLNSSRPRRKCNSTLLLDSSNFKEISAPFVIKRVAYDSDLNQIKSNIRNNEDIKMDTIQLSRVKPSQCTLASNRVQSRIIPMAHENLLPIDKTIQIAYD